MAAFNLTPSSQATLILSGIPGLEAAHIWISIPLSTFYIISLLGNFMVLFVVGKEQTLHKPMYLLLCMLEITDIGLSTSVMPKTLCIFWIGFKEITVEGCLIQMFFIHTVVATQSAILVTMAFDRYVAICDPLRYTTILTNERTVKLGLVGLTRSVLLLLPVSLLLQGMPFCSNHVIPHTFCEHMAVVKMSCADTTVNQMYGLVTISVLTGLDLTLIGLSYGMILRAVLSVSSRKTHQKALNTCTAHICVILISYTSSLFSSLAYRYGQGIGAHFHSLVANFSILISPMLNPVIYSIKNKELRDKMGKYFCRM